MLKLMVFLVLIISLLAGGCATIKNAPTRSVDPWAEVESLKGLFTMDGYLNFSGNPIEQKTYRDNLINARIFMTDLNFEKFQQDLVREGALKDLGSEWANLGLTGASAVVPLAQTKTVLSAIAAGITGANVSVDKNLYFKKTIPALITQMKADRKTLLLAIREKMKKDTKDYPLTAALIDLEEYYKAGTIPQAITSINVTAGATIKEKDEKLERIVTGKYVKDQAGELLLKYWKPDGKSVNKDHRAALLVWMQKNGIKDADKPGFILFFIQTAEYSALRAKAVGDLQLQ